MAANLGIAFNEITTAYKNKDGIGFYLGEQDKKNLLFEFSYRQLGFKFLEVGLDTLYKTALSYLETKGDLAEFARRYSQQHRLVAKNYIAWAERLETFAASLNKCSNCNGDGFPLISCPTCKGTGKV